MGLFINGEGTGLWGVIRVDSDRDSDSKLEMWLANDKNNLYEQMMEEMLQGEENDWLIDIIKNDFENDWEVRILPNEIDTSRLPRP